MSHLLIFMAVVLLCNLAPAFAPPTWSIIVLFSFNTTLPIWVLVATGAVMAASGRYGLARYTAAFERLIPKKTVENLHVAGKYFQSKRKYLFITLFALSPVPSAQLFEAAGLMRLPLKKLTFAFFAGRIVSYSIYATGAHSLKDQSFGKTMVEYFKSPWGLLLELLMIGGLVWLSKIDWKRYVRTHP